MEGDIYLNTVVSSLTEQIGYLISGFFLAKLGFHRAYYLSFALTLLGCLLYLTLDLHSQIFVALALLCATLGMASSLNIDWSTNAVLFPVIYTSSTNGICNLFARISNMFAPQAAELTQPWPMVIVTGMCLFGILISR